MKDKIIRYFGDASQEYSKVLKERFVTIPENNRINTDCIYFMEQIHSDHVVIIDDIATQTTIIPQCDGLITSKKNSFLAVKTADCYPILIYDDLKGVIAVAHSGREGTKQKILEKIIDIMKKHYSCEPENIKVEIGAGICANHYQVSKQITDDFLLSFPDLSINEFLDLKEIIKDTAIKNGIFIKNITTSPECTFESEKYFSYRRDKNDKRQISLIGMMI